MKSEKREKKNENRKMKTPVYDGEEILQNFIIFIYFCSDLDEMLSEFADILEIDDF